MNSRLFTLSLIAAVASAGLVAAASAATVTYSTAMSGGSLTPLGIDGLDSATFPQFNPSLGTLTKVTMSNVLRGTLLSGVSIYADPTIPVGTPMTVGLSPVADFYYPGPDLDDPLQSETQLGQTATLTAPMPFIDSSTNQSATGVLTTNQFSSFTITDGTGVDISSNGVTGTGTVTEQYYDPYLWGAVANLTNPTQAAYRTSSDYSYTGTLSLTYTYTAAPEPASISLLGAAAASLLLRRRR